LCFENKGTERRETKKIGWEGKERKENRYTIRKRKE